MDNNNIRVSVDDNVVIVVIGVLAETNLHIALIEGEVEASQEQVTKNPVVHLDILVASYSKVAIVSEVRLFRVDI